MQLVWFMKHPCVWWVAPQGSHQTNTPLDKTHPAKTYLAKTYLAKTYLAKTYLAKTYLAKTDRAKTRLQECLGQGRLERSSRQQPVLGWQETCLCCRG